MITNPPVDQPVLDKTNNGLFSMPWRLWLSQFNIVATTLTTVSDVTGTAPITSTGGTTPAIGIPKANAGVDGYLSSTDWVAFNNKGNMFVIDGQDGDDGQAVPGPVGPTGATGATVYLEAPEAEEPMFTGGPTVPVKGSLTWSVPVTKTADFTLGVFETYVINNKAAATCTVTLPSASGYPGRAVTFKNYQAFTVVSASSNVVPPAGGAAGTAILAASIGDWATLVSDGTNWINVLSAPNNILLLE